MGPEGGTQQERQVPGEPYPTTARALLMDGEDGGVAVASRLRPELEGGDVEGTVRLTTGASSPSPVRDTQLARGSPLPQWQPALLWASTPCHRFPGECGHHPQPSPLACWPHSMEAKGPSSPVAGESSTSPTFTTWEKRRHRSCTHWKQVVENNSHHYTLFDVGF